LALMYAGCSKLALYSECHYAKCHYAECHYAECRGVSYDHSNWWKSLSCTMIVDQGPVS
jgi:hypothetical protein